MPRLKNPEELSRLQRDLQRARKLRLETGTTIAVGAGTCGIAAGARETLRAIGEELKRRQIDAHVVSVGCIGLCVKEPLVEIQQGGKPRILYANIMADMVPRLIEEHLVKGEPVKQWVIGRMPAE